MAFEFYTDTGESPDLQEILKTDRTATPISRELNITRRAQERTSFTQKRAHMPRENTPYEIEDFLDVLYTDAFVREIMDSYNEDNIRTMIIGQKMKLFAYGTEVRFILERTVQGYIFTGIFGVTPFNDRSVCCSGSAQDLQFGMGFMALGGNSYPKR